MMSDLEGLSASSSEEDVVSLDPGCVTKAMSVSEVCSYLKGKGIPVLYCDIFKG